MPTRGRAASRGRRAARQNAVDAEHVAIATDEVDLLVGPDPAQRGAPVREEHEAGVARELAGGLEVERTVVVELVEVTGGDVELGHAGVAGVGVRDRLGPVLLGVQADRGRLDPQRQVLGDQGDGVPLVGEVAGDRQDPGVVVAEPEAGRQGVGVGVVELDPDRPALVAHRDRLVEPAVVDPQLVEHAQRRSREEPQLGMVPFALELGDDHDRQHHLVLVEPLQRTGVGQQDARVEHERAGGRCGGAGGLRLLRRGRHDVTPPVPTSFPTRRYDGKYAEEARLPPRHARTGGDGQVTAQEPKRRSRCA